MGTGVRTALVTGGGRGLGRAIARQLAADGLKVGVVARTEGELRETVGLIRDDGGEAEVFPADVLDASALRRAFGRFGEWAGGLDALVCAAGRMKGVGPVGLVDPGEWWGDVETSLRGVYQSLTEALPMLRASAAASVSVLVGPGHNGELPHASGYGAAQAALVRLVESVAKEWAAASIPVYAVNPGFVLTDLVRGLVDTPEGRRWLPRFNEALAEGKEVGPEVVAEMTSWLAAERPREWNGRVVAALQTPQVAASRGDRVASENLGVLRLR